MCRAPARQIRPSLCTHPGRIAVGAEELNLETRRGKNVPIFATLRRFLRDGRAQVGTLAPRGSSIENLNCRRGIPKGGVFVKSHPLAEFFGYFLVQRQESNITKFLCGHKKRTKDFLLSKISPQGLWNVEI